MAPGLPSPSPLSFASWEAVDRSIPIDYHLHTTYTDGTASIDEMAEAAHSAGISEVLFSEHVRHTSTYFHTFADEVRMLNHPGLKTYVGAEAKILDQAGTLDCSPEVSALCDALIGSVHSPPLDEDGTQPRWSDMDPKTALALEFQLALAIVTGSQAHILGHPMGMVITRFDLRPLDELYALACACYDHDKAFELNNRYCASTQDWIDIVRRTGCKISIGSDAHRTAAVGHAWEQFMKGQEWQT